MLHYIVKLFTFFFTSGFIISDLSSSLSSDGYAFSQEEHGVVSQSQVVRSYDTTRQRPSL